MRHEAARPYWDDIGLVKLLIGVFIGPATWALNLEINYSLLKWACRSGTPQVLPVISSGALALTVFGLIVSYRAFTQLRARADLHGGRIFDRSYFLALAGIGLGAFFALLILTAGSLHFIVGPCE
jgi:hypothetical protein